MPTQSFNRDLCEFLDTSPTPYHAVANIRRQLIAAGFEELQETQAWQTQSGGKYLVCRNDSSIIAWTQNQQALADTGFRMIGAHTDSPCLKVKPNAAYVKNGYYQLGVEVYGGVLLNPWFDRDLGLAGRITISDGKGQLRHLLLDFEKPVAIIPSLAIHLDREVNKKRVINAQLHLPPILMFAEEKIPDLHQLLRHRCQKQYPEIDCNSVWDYELSFYDCQAAALVGLQQEFLTSARLDNLLSCFIGLRSLQECEGETNALLVCNDHEEVGSASAIGAQGPFLKSILQRLNQNTEDYHRCISRSTMISVDNAHAVHPNYADRHDEHHEPQLNGGPVLKINSSQRYASNSETGALFRLLCQECDVAVQFFVSRSDMACGSTIGPLTATELGVRTVDVGVPQFAMHSIRETAGSLDSYRLFGVLNHYLNKTDLFRAL